MREKRTTATPKKSEVIGTVHRVLGLIRQIADAGEGFSLAEIARLQHLPISSTHRLLCMLAAEGFVKKSEVTKLYRPGPELLRISVVTASQLTINEIGRPHLQEVVRACDEVCMLVLYQKETRQVMVIDSVNSSTPLRYQIDHFQPTSLFWGATGRSVLAFLPQAEIEAAFGSTEKAPSDGKSLPSFKTLLKELAVIRSKRYSLTWGQKMKGAVGMGAPLFNSRGRVIGSLCITIPQVRFNPSQEASLARLLLHQAELLTADLVAKGVELV